MNNNQDFEAAKNWYKIAKEQNNQQAIDILEQLFPTLKDIYIVDTLVSICNRALPDIFKKYGCDKDDVLEWLNSQYDKNMSLTDILNNDIPKRQATGTLKEMIDETNNTTYEPKFSKGDYIIRNTDGYIHNTYYINDVMDDYYVCTELSSRYNITLSFEEVDNTFKLWDISDAKAGDILIHNSITFIFKGIENGVVKGICTELSDTILNFGEPVYDNDYCPATKEQRDTFFIKMKEDGWKWDAEKKELKKLNIKLKFNEGDWVVDEEDNSVHQIKLAIENVTYGGFSYDLTDNGYFPYAKSNYHLWTIKDAKDGDIVVVPSIEGSEHSEQIFIFKEIKDRDYAKNTVEYYCKVCDNEFYVNKTSFMGQSDDYCFVPATQEQRKLLFQKMKEAEYKWDEQNKKLIKYTDFDGADKNEDPSLFDNYDPYKVAVQHIIETCYEYEDVIDPDTYASEFYDEIIAKCNNAIEYDNKHPKKKSLNVDDLTNIQSITKILNNAKKYYCNDDEIVRGIEWVNSLKNI